MSDASNRPAAYAWRCGEGHFFQAQDDDPADWRPTCKRCLGAGGVSRPFMERVAVFFDRLTVSAAPGYQTIEQRRQDWLHNHAGEPLPAELREAQDA